MKTRNEIIDLFKGNEWKVEREDESEVVFSKEGHPTVTIGEHSITSYCNNLYVSVLFSVVESVFVGQNTKDIFMNPVFGCSISF